MTTFERDLRREGWATIPGRGLYRVFESALDGTWQVSTPREALPHWTEPGFDSREDAIAWCVRDAGEEK